MKKLVLIISLILLAIFGGLYIFLQLKVKDYTQIIENSNVQDSAKIIFDTYGIPHIYASNNEDAFKLLGYVQASDRLFQMELMRRVGSGQLSEILGADLLETDMYIRTVGLEENAKRAAEAFENETDLELKRNVLAFLEGVNLYVKNGITPIEYTLLDIEKKPFQVIDIYRILGYMGFGFSMELKNEPLFTFINNNLGTNYLTDLAIGTQSTDEKIPVQNHIVDTTSLSLISDKVESVLSKLPLPIFYGSNSWVISGSKTKSGKVLFANDTHIGFSQPSVWYEAHIETPDMEIYGNFLAGIPYPIVAHTKHHSWGLTIFPADALDLFNEQVKGDSVMYKNEWTSIQEREELINIKGEKPYDFIVKSTPHGPIISGLDQFSEDFSTAVSFWWVANKVVDQKLQALALLAQTNNFRDLEIATKNIDSPGLNVMYGDVDGNIGWIGSGKLIKRPAHVNSKIVLDGASGKDDPLGFYDFKYNPRNINPESGFVYSANNSPDSVNGNFYPGYYYSGARAKVIKDKIQSRDDWDLESMKELVMNNQSPIYPNNLKVILSQITTSTEIENKVKDVLLNWNGGHGLTSIAPTIYYKLIFHILNKTMEDEIGKKRFELFISTPVYLHSVGPLLRNDSSSWWDNTSTTEIENRTHIFQESYSQTIEELTNQLGNDISSWTWNKVHFVEHPHPIGRKKPMNHIFNVGPFPSPGGEEVVNKIAFTLNREGIYIARSGPAMRILLDFSDIENSLSINPTGESGYFMDPHYDDQAQMFIDGEFRTQEMNKNEISKSKIGVWEFLP